MNVEQDNRSLKLSKKYKIQLQQGDCLELMRGMKDNSVDLVMGSPPYETRRTYGIGFNLKGQDWVDWMVDIVQESVRISKGLVAFVVEGQNNNYRYSCTPALLMADLHRSGIHLRKPAIYKRHGIPGGSGPDWLRNDWEWIICASKPGRLPWNDNTAFGKPMPKHKHVRKPTFRMVNGTRQTQNYKHPDKSNPGNIIDDRFQYDNPSNVIEITPKVSEETRQIIKDNEAPYSYKVARFFIKSFCPPDGIVLDPFLGSGTTIAEAIGLGRRAIGFDVRASQVKLAERRILSPWEDKSEILVTYDERKSDG